ncbi:MAG: hypothetical protein JO071_09775 [Deltaproteobacteria bacterium]|nr:hypothetical protein [Deltaproteobacteria bacterium]
MEDEAAECYFHLPAEVGTHIGDAGDVYLRILRDLRRVHSHIAALAYPILERASFLQDRAIAPTADTAESAPETSDPAQLFTAKSTDTPRTAPR